MKNFVESKYPRSEIFQSHPTIVLNLNHIKFELVPAIKNHYSSAGVFCIPSPSSAFLEWMETHPNDANKSVINHNVLHSSNSKRIIRLLKYWNCKCSTKPFSSFEIENSIVSQNLYTTSNLRDYFFAAVDRLPSGIYSKSLTKQNEILRLKKTIDKVRQHERQNNILDAKYELRKVIPSIY